MSLTAAQLKVYNFIRHVHSDTDSMPAYGVIAAAMGYNSANAAVCAVKILIEKGYLEPIDRGYRFKRRDRISIPWQREGISVNWMSNVVNERISGG